MQTLEQLRGQIDTAEGLLSVVRTMKGLAAVNIRQYDKAAQSLREYVRTLERSMQILLRRDTTLAAAMTDTEAHGRAALLAVGSDQGMVGQFNNEIARRARDRLEELNAAGRETVLLTVGERLSAELGAGGRSVDRQFDLPGAVEAIARAVEDILVELQRLRGEEGVDQIELLAQQPKRASAYEPAHWRILPIDPHWIAALAQEPWPTNQVPMVAGETRMVLAALVRQFLWAGTYRALAFSLAAENAARLASMQSAEQNIDERLGGLRQKYHQRRQSQITEELLEVVAGFEVLGQQD